MNPLPLATALHYATQIVSWLNPYCHRLTIAGSIRRARPWVNDIDIVAIPIITEATDMLGAVIARKNHCLQFLQDYVTQANPSASKHTTPHFISGGENEDSKQILIQLPKCQLDLWFATPETFATRLLMRTGSKEHNIWLCERAANRSLRWNPYAGLSDPASPGAFLPAETEEQLYNYLGLEFIAPQNREPAWIAKNLEFGLATL